MTTSGETVKKKSGLLKNLYFHCEQKSGDFMWGFLYNLPVKCEFFSRLYTCISVCCNPKASLH